MLSICHCTILCWAELCFKLPLRGDCLKRGPHSFGESSEKRSAERGGFLVPRATNRDTELVCLHLQHHVEHRGATIDA